MKAIVIGAGIGGLACSLALRRIGWDVIVYEREATIPLVGAGLGVGANAYRMLQVLGLGERVMQIGNQVDELHFFSDRGQLLNRTYTTELSRNLGTTNLTVHRGELLRALMEPLQTDGIICYNKACVFVEQNDRGVRVWFSDGSMDEGDILIGADGIRSAIRKTLLPHVEPRYMGYTCWRGVVKPEEGVMTYSPNISMETWGRAGRFGIVPLSSGRIYWYICMNATEADPVLKAMNTKDLAEHFDKYHKPIPQILQLAQEEALLHHDIYELPELEQFCFNRIALLGDAAHATTPNMGQGAGQAIEDAISLATHLRHAPSVDAAFQRYELERKKRTSLITRMSRWIGKMAQLDGSAPIMVRNALFRNMPKSVMNKPLEFLFRMKVNELDIG